MKNEKLYFVNNTPLNIAYSWTNLFPVYTLKNYFDSLQTV